MRDVVMLAVITVFFALCLAYVRWCDHIIGPDPMDQPGDDVAGDGYVVAAGVEEVSA